MTIFELTCLPIVVAILGAALKVAFNTGKTVQSSEETAQAMKEMRVEFTGLANKVGMLTSDVEKLKQWHDGFHAGVTRRVEG